MLLSLSLLLLISFLLSELAHHFHYPRVLGQVVAGMVVGLPALEFLVSESMASSIGVLSEMGIVFLFMVIGIEINLDHLRAEKKRALLVGISGFLVPFILGITVGIVLGLSLLTSLVIGVCLAISSESTNAQIFMEFNKFKTRLARVIFGAAMIDDLCAILFLTVLVTYLQGGHGSLIWIPINILAFMGVIVLLMKVMPKFISHIEKDESNIAEFSMMVVFGMLLSALAIKLGVGEIIGAFLGGLIIQKGLRHECTELCGPDRKKHQHQRRFFKKNITMLKIVTLSLIIPFFFINMGLSFEIQDALKNPSLILIIVGAAILGKFGGVFLVTHWTKFNRSQQQLVGWGMNSRGALELVIAQLALTNQIINPEIYSTLVIMVFVTTLSFPFFLRRILKKNPRVMNLIKR